MTRSLAAQKLRSVEQRAEWQAGGLERFGGAFLAGLGLASLFPIFIAWLSKWFGVRARKVGGVMFAMAAAGSALMPPLVGLVSGYARNLRVGLLVPLAGCAIMLAVISLLRPSTRG